MPIGKGNKGFLGGAPPPPKKMPKFWGGGGGGDENPGHLAREMPKGNQWFFFESLAFGWAARQ